jgi:hypothetical protein
MIKLKVRTLFLGRVGIRGKYITRALERKIGLDIKHDGSTMLIPAGLVKTSIVAKSDRPVYDKFKGEQHWLFYYNWRPQRIQNKLL